jgi:hypothetical protein
VIPPPARLPAFDTGYSPAIRAACTASAMARSSGGVGTPTSRAIRSGTVNIASISIARPASRSCRIGGLWSTLPIVAIRSAAGTRTGRPSARASASASSPMRIAAARITGSPSVPFEWLRVSRQSGPLAMLLTSLERMSVRMSSEGGQAIPPASMAPASARRPASIDPSGAPRTSLPVGASSSTTPGAITEEAA